MERSLDGRGRAPCQRPESSSSRATRFSWQCRTRPAVNQTRVGKEYRTISCLPHQERISWETLGYLHPKSRQVRRVLHLAVAIAAVLLTACELVPSKPEAVFVLYRDRMKSEQFAKARDLLTDTSKNFATQLARDYRLKQLPENLAVLNILDPVTPPVITEVEATVALLQVRTLKGGVRLVRLVRETPNGSWKIDISQELKALQTFLGARSALDTVREQAGEYAASWRAFSDQLSRMKVSEDEPGKNARDAK